MMLRGATVLLLLLLAAPLRAEPFAALPALDQRLITEVASHAIAFMLPRTLEDVHEDELSLWGLRGLSSIDPRLAVDQSGANIRLSLRGSIVYTHPAPPIASSLGAGSLGASSLGASSLGGPQAWAEAIANVSLAAWDISEPVRRAGTEGVIRSFFDDLFNHLDPYSRYASPQEAAADSSRRNGRAGIGIELAQSRGGFVVHAIATGSPAARAGIRPGERLTAIDDQPLDGADLAAAHALLAGPADTRVTLSLGTGRANRSVELVRRLVTQPTVFAQRQGSLAVIRITGFVHDTASSLATELGRIPPGPGIRGLVIDLRGNRGGLLRQAVAAAETLVPSGLLARTEGRDPAASQSFEANGADLAHGLPIVVLVDGRSASAAEILAAALADRRRAVVVGSATLGKGLVQTVYPLPDQGALSLTWSRVLAPKGWPIQALGLLPQLCTSLGEDSLRRQMTDLAAGFPSFAAAIERHRAARAPVSAAETLEIRSACPAAEGRDSDLTAARFLAETPQAYAAALVP
jgi:carboxyl-terminal processing protease